MIITLLNILLFCIAINSYAKKKYVASVVILAFFTTNAFILNIGVPYVKYIDFGLLEIAACTIIGICRFEKFFSISTFPGKLFFTFFIFLIVVFLYSLIIHADSLSNIFSVLRSYFYIFSYFTLRVIPKEKLEKSVRIIFKLTIFACVCFILQYITHLELVDTYIAEGSKTYRMQITPPFMMPFTLALLLFGNNIRWRYLYLLILFVVFIIAQNRTPIVSMGLLLPVYFLFAYNTKHKYAIALTLLVAFPFISSMFNQRAENENSSALNSLGGIGTNISSTDYASLSHESTFLFRIAMIEERLNYLNEHPAKSLLGIGAMHEMSSNNKFNFLVGTAYVSKGGSIEKAQIQSNDTLWSSVILRFGYVGVMVFLSYMFLSTSYFFKKRQNRIAFLGFLLFLASIIGSLSSGGAFSCVSILTHSLLFNFVEKNIKII